MPRENVFDDITLLDNDVAVIPLEDPEQRSLRETDSDLVVPDPEDPDIPSDLHIPSQAKQRCDQGIVRNVGPNVDPDIYIGAHVFFPGYAGDEVNIEGIGRLVLIPDRGIQFILEGYGEEYFLLPQRTVLNEIDKVRADLENTDRMSDEVEVFIEKLEHRLENWDTRQMRF